MACSTIAEYSRQEGFYRVPLPAARQTPNLEDQWLERSNSHHVPHVWNYASEPQQRKVELWARNCQEFCRKWLLLRHFWVLLHAVNLRHGTDGFSRFWARKLGHQRTAHLRLDHRSLQSDWEILFPLTQFEWFHSVLLKQVLFESVIGALESKIPCLKVFNSM